MKLDILLPLYKPQADWEKKIISAVTFLQSALGDQGELNLYLTNDGAPAEYYPPEKLQQISDAVNGRFYFLPYEKNQGKGKRILKKN